MKFEWDDAKNRANIRKHGFDFAEAIEMFAWPVLIRPDTRDDYGEDRWIGIGITKDRFAFVAFTEREPGTLRIISLRKATNEERKDYEKTIPDGLETN